MIRAALECLASAVWRLWLGGTPRFVPIERGLTALQYVVGLALAGGAAWFQSYDWKAAAIAAVGYLIVWRGLGHGPMLSFPLGPNAKDPILRLIRADEFQWWLYAFLRYSTPLAAIGAALWAIGGKWWPPAVAAVVLMAAYRVTFAYRESLPYAIVRAIADLSKTPDYSDSMQPYNFAHPIAGAAVLAGILWALP